MRLERWLLDECRYLHAAPAEQRWWATCAPLGVPSADGRVIDANDGWAPELNLGDHGFDRGATLHIRAAEVVGLVAGRVPCWPDAAQFNLAAPHWPTWLGAGQ